jgi:negative regulator of sigma E activity
MTSLLFQVCQNRLNRRVLTVVLVGALWSAGWAQAQPFPTDPVDGFAWLRRIDEAARRYNFQGITVVSGKGALISTSCLSTSSL